MKTIKHINKNTISINKAFYKGYILGDLPPTFSFLYKQETDGDGKVFNVYGISKWLNYKGLTWLKL